MAPDECIEFKQPFPASHTLEELYIDEHMITQILPSRRNRPQHVAIEMKSRSQHARHQIPTSEKKAFAQVPNFVAWGK